MTMWVCVSLYCAVLFWCKINHKTIAQNVNDKKRKAEMDGDRSNTAGGVSNNWNAVSWTIMTF